MRKMETRLRERGYRVVNIDYPSREKTVEQLAGTVIPGALNQCDAARAQTVHFVTHSMGGILVRYFLQHHGVPNLGRVVMTGPPNQGSQVVDAWRNVPGFSLLNGRAGDQLGTDPGGIAAQLGPVSYPVGVIAGTRSINLILSLSLPGPNDGKVTVANTRVEGMADFVALPVAHPFIPADSRVIRQTMHFLERGTFDHPRARKVNGPADSAAVCGRGGEIDQCQR